MKPQETIFLIVTIFLLGTSLTVWAQGVKPGQIGGSLYKPDGSEAPNTPLLIRHVTTNVTQQEVTDKHGRFRFKKVVPGEYQVESTFNGTVYRYTATALVKPGELTLLCLQMRDKDLVLFQREGRCEPEPAAVIWPWIVGGGVVVGGVIVFLATREEASPTRP